MAGTAGIAASGHECTSAAAVEVLAAGGNAFDGATAALCAACVCEPLLTSLGGGGFLMAYQQGREPRVYDFFAHTPRRRRHADEIDFYPILADFGTATQEFHIGHGSMAVPGVIAGLFAINRDLGRLDMPTVMAPAIRLAREGVRINALQNSISHILLAILQGSPGAMRLVATAEQPDRIAPATSVVTNRPLGDVMEELATEGPDLFYRGELAQQLVRDCRSHGGMLTLEDLAGYQVLIRKPVQLAMLGANMAFNAPPSPGGTLLAVAMAMLEGIDLKGEEWGSDRHCLAIAHAMQAASRLRSEKPLNQQLDEDAALALLADTQLEAWRRQAMPSKLFARGTTHLSIADEEGNLASLTSSNGEGCAYVLPDTGIMMNNMLGEEDLNPEGFHRWPENHRLASMMCPTVAHLPDGSQLALGSGGSNRIRSAVLQVLTNLLEFDLPLADAVTAPRMHLEGAHLSIETGYPQAGLDVLQAEWPEVQIWPLENMFFGGVHAVKKLPDGSFRGAGDPRRGGLVAQCN